MEEVYTPQAKQKIIIIKSILRKYVLHITSLVYEKERHDNGDKTIRLFRIPVYHKTKSKNRS